MRVLLPRTVRPAVVTAPQLASIRERFVLHATTSDANVLASLTPQLARDVRALVDHHDALSYGEDEGIVLSPDDPLIRLASCLTRFEQTVDLGERSTLQAVLARGVEPLLCRIDAIVAEGRIPEDPRATIPPFGWGLHVEEAERLPNDTDWPNRRSFDVWLAHARLQVRARVTSSTYANPWWFAVIGSGEEFAFTGAKPLEVLQIALHLFFADPRNASFRKCGFEPNAILAEFLRLGPWLTPEERKQIARERGDEALEILKRVQPDLVRLLREHGLDTGRVHLRAGASARAWELEPRMRIEIEIDEPRRE